jgi:hypothetical protein
MVSEADDTTKSGVVAGEAESGGCRLEVEMMKGNWVSGSNA